MNFIIKIINIIKGFQKHFFEEFLFRKNLSFKNKSRGQFFYFIKYQITFEF